MSTILFKYMWVKPLGWLTPIVKILALVPRCSNLRGSTLYMKWNLKWEQGQLNCHPNWSVKYIDIKVVGITVIAGKQ